MWELVAVSTRQALYGYDPVLTEEDLGSPLRQPCFMPYGSLPICIHSLRVCWAGRIVPQQLSLSGLYFLLPYSPYYGCGSTPSSPAHKGLLRMVNVALTVSSFEDHFLVVYAISLIEAHCVYKKKFRYQSLQHIPLTIKEKKVV